MNLDSITAAEAAIKAQKNSWGTWRRIEKDMKERRSELKKADLKTQQSRLRTAKEEVDAADLVDARNIRLIEARILAIKNREKEKRERAERKRQEKIWKQHQEERQNREREAAEALRKQQAELRVTERKRQEEEARRWQDMINRASHLYPNEEDTYQAHTSICRHDGWWPKVQGRTDCPRCFESWTYLLQCPSCETRACPRCQRAMRPRIPRGTARTDRKDVPRARASSPNSYSDYD